MRDFVARWWFQVVEVRLDYLINCRDAVTDIEFKIPSQTGSSRHFVSKQEFTALACLPHSILIIVMRAAGGHLDFV
jgi:hypothetical protein